MGKARLIKRQRREQPVAENTSKDLAPHRITASAFAIAIILVLFITVFLGLSVYSYRQKSAVWDEPVHLTAGYVALARSDYRTEPEHPPFLRMWAALPLLAINGIKLDTTGIGGSNLSQWASGYVDLIGFCRRFLYADNDADKLLYSGRFMVALLGVALGVLLFFWAYEWQGLTAGVFCLFFFAFEPNIAAHSSLITTDFAITCFIFGAIYFLWRTCDRVSAGNVVGFVAFFNLSILSKFSGLIIILITALLLTYLVWSRRIKRSIALRLIGIALVSSYCLIWAIYGFRYAPSSSPTSVFHFQDVDMVVQRTPALARTIKWVDGLRILPNAFTQGFLMSQARAQFRGAFLAGEYSTAGWWYYFPVAILIKTPIGLLIAFFAGLFLLIRKWKQWGREAAAFILFPTASILIPAMNAHLNIGLRHILPIYPFIILLAAVTADSILRSYKRGQAVVIVLVVLMVFEFSRAYPNNLTFFNAFVGGPGNGSKYLVDSNLDWGQDLKPLSSWMRTAGANHINLAYFGSADPAYYHINYTYLPGGDFGPSEPPQPPTLPGYVAVSDTILSGAYLNDAGRVFYRPLRERKPNLTIGNSISVYWVENPWW